MTLKILCKNAEERRKSNVNSYFWYASITLRYYCDLNPLFPFFSLTSGYLLPPFVFFLPRSAKGIPRYLTALETHRLVSCAALLSSPFFLFSSGWFFRRRQTTFDVRPLSLSQVCIFFRHIWEKIKSFGAPIRMGFPPFHFLPLEFESSPVPDDINKDLEEQKEGRRGPWIKKLSFAPPAS